MTVDALVRRYRPTDIRLQHSDGVWTAWATVDGARYDADAYRAGDALWLAVTGAARRAQDAGVAS
jgi:hypothetical protein